LGHPTNSDNMSDLVNRSASAVKTFFTQLSEDAPPSEPESPPPSNGQRKFEGHGVGQGMGGGGMIGFHEAGLESQTEDQQRERDGNNGRCDSKAEAGEVQEMAGLGGLFGGAGGGIPDVDELGDHSGQMAGSSSSGRGTTSLTLGGGITGGS